MKLQVLVATMHQTDFSKVDEMRIRTDCILANQTDSTSYAYRDYPFGRAERISTGTCGIGRNRNLALMYAKADILLIADEDICYQDGYQETVLSAFREIPDADCIVFNVDSTDPCKKRRRSRRISRLHRWNALCYGAVRLAVRRSSILRENIMFHLNFGGGTAFSAGEDTLFIADMLRHGLHLYAYPATIATVDDTPGTSSWFHGYNEKYYYDQGVITGAIYRHIPCLMCLQFLIRHPNYKKSGLTFLQAWNQMQRGMAGYQTMTPFRQGPD